MKNFKLYKQACLAFSLAATLSLTGCGSEKTRVVSNESIINVKGSNNHVVVNGSSSLNRDNSVMVNGVSIIQENDELKLQVNGQNITINGSEEKIDNMEIEIKPNDIGDGNLVFIKNIYEYIVEDGFVQYGIILDIPNDKSLRDTAIYSFNYKTIDEYNHVYTLYEVDQDGNETLIETHYISDPVPSLTN